MPWSNYQLKISYLPNSCYVTVPKQGPVTACDNMNFWAPFSNNPRWIQVLHVNISCIYTIVQVTLLFLQEITFALQPKGVWKKTRCKSHPSPWTHSWRGVLSQVPPQLSLAAAESQKTWKSFSSLQGKFRHQNEPCEVTPHRGLQNPVIKQWKKQLLPSHLHEQIRFSEWHKTQSTRKPPGPTSATLTHYSR